jgi:hypothetical protein
MRFIESIQPLRPGFRSAAARPCRLSLLAFLFLAVTSVHAVPGTPPEGAAVDSASPAQVAVAATFAPVPVTFGPVASSPLLADVLHDLMASSMGIAEVTPERLLATHELDELQLLTFSPAALSHTALYDDPNRVIYIGGKRIEPLVPQKRSMVKPMVFLFVGVMAMILIALLVPRLVTGFTGGGPVQRKGSRR